MEEESIDQPTNNQIQELENNESKHSDLEGIFGEDKDLAVFVATWLELGLNASQAYKKLHPEVTEHSARTLGSRMLAKVDISTILTAFGLGREEYFRQLKEGLNAMKWNDFTGEREPDHRTRKPYHQTLGKLLRLETDDKQTIIEQKPPRTLHLRYADGTEIGTVRAVLPPWQPKKL